MASDYLPPSPPPSPPPPLLGVLFSSLSVSYIHVCTLLPLPHHVPLPHFIALPVAACGRWDENRPVLEAWDLITLPDALIAGGLRGSETATSDRLACHTNSNKQPQNLASSHRTLASVALESLQLTERGNRCFAVDSRVSPTI